MVGTLFPRLGISRVVGLVGGGTSVSYCDSCRGLSALLGRITDPTHGDDTLKTFKRWAGQVRGVEVGCFEYYSRFWNDYSRFVLGLRKDSFPTWFYDSVVRRVMMRLEEMLRWTMGLRRKYSLFDLRSFVEIWRIRFDEEWGH